MSDSNENPGTETTGENSGENNSNESELTPEQLKSALTNARNEAARYRTKLRDAETRLTNAKTPEDVEAARAELAEENKKLARELLVERIGKGLPDDLLPLLTGKTEEELKAQAEALKKHLPVTTDTKTPPKKLSGGLNASEGDKDFDAVKVARQLRAGW